MFNTFITQPVFNILVTIYSLLPGHDFGVTILLFSLLARVVMWPLIKKQLNHSKEMKKLQPELAKIRKECGDDKQKLAQLQLELYKDREINPLAPLGFMLVQIPLFLGLYFAVRKLVENPESILTETYEPVRNLSWVQEIQNSDFSKFQESFLGIIDDLSLPAIGDSGWQWPLIVIALSTGLIQFYQTRQLLPAKKTKKKLREVLSEGQSNGGEPDKEELQAAVGRTTSFILPALITFLSLTFPGAIALYWFSNTAVGFIQQRYILNTDNEEMNKIKVTTKKKNTGSTSAKGAKKVKSTSKTTKGSNKNKKKTTPKKKAKKK